MQQQQQQQQQQQPQHLMKLNTWFTQHHEIKNNTSQKLLGINVKLIELSNYNVIVFDF